MLIRRAGLVFLVALALHARFAPSARAQDAWTSSIDHEMLTLTTPDDTDIISPSRRPIVSGFEGRHSIELVPQPDGADLRVTLHNPSSASIPCGDFYIGGIRLNNRITYYDMRNDARPVALDNHGGPFFHRSFVYPNQTYSPVAVFGDRRYTFGISLLYPILEYEHNVELQLESPGGGFTLGGTNWEQRLRIQGQLAPGETRTYVITIRVVPAGENWLRTLVPYRDYFNGLYGGVRYTRDPRPVLHYVAAQTDSISPSNPYGFFQPKRRPDIYGWKPTADYLRERAREGWQRVMIWTPTGLFQHNQRFNYPFLFMTQMRNVPAMNSSMGELRGLASDMQVGYWWGNSQLVLDSWNTDTGEPFDPDNPDHVRRGFAELDLAVSLGATTIGLDTFGRTPVWDSYRWLEMMRERAPGVTFITEPVRADILHTLAPTLVFASKGRAQTPKILADFLLPGHETWGLIRFGDIEADLGRPLSQAERHAEVVRVAALGYVPVFGDRNANPTDPAFQAAESWRTTVPQDLRIERVGASGPDGSGHPDGTRAVRSSATGAPDPNRPAPRPNVVLAGSPSAPGTDDPTATRNGIQRFSLRGFQHPEPAPPSPAAASQGQLPVRFTGRPNARRSAPLAPFTAEQAAEALERLREHRSASSG